VLLTICSRFFTIASLTVMAPTTSSRLITLDDLTPQNLGVLKKLNSVLFPVPYSEKFYKESLNVGELAKLGMSQSTP
jgi:hypothetical protein